uniref:Tetratricopeptide repeat-containing protein n=1 Tax=Candidatus Kentrum eta TaxID=2126337 RepID=A0A450VXX0_9GAMM|nr:MAG: Tetratricopeptide repeat-containing protein [Candidatus Kentron sp. H]VFK05445.1 MAG: Tetratricopeptide repeat-containing protein [Candidatus Kentron sp. H]VFK09683.1 MAG: Tetratricopeptide repeat-containing protein [Candidatus Kentron sp. H]
MGKLQLGTARLEQCRHPEALAARRRFTQLGEPTSVATAWHQTGMAYEGLGQPAEAEAAYREALAIRVRLGNAAGQAATLLQLGLLYNNRLERPEEAVAFYRQAADKYVELGDAAKEGVVHSNLAETLRGLRRPAEAREAIQRAIHCRATE